MAITIAFISFLYVTWFIYFRQYVFDFSLYSLFFTIATTLSWYNLYQSYKVDPGVVVSNRDQMANVKNCCCCCKISKLFLIWNWKLILDNFKIRRTKRIFAWPFVHYVYNTKTVAFQTLLRVRSMRGQIRSSLPVGGQLYRRKKSQIFHRISILDAHLFGLLSARSLWM